MVFNFLRSLKKDFVHTLQLSFPIMLGQVGSVLMGITDTLMLGNVGKEAVAASGVANQIYFLFTVLGMGTIAAMAPMIATSKGAQNDKECGEILRTGIELGFLISVVLCLIMILIGENFEWFQQPAAITALVKPYLRILTISTIPFMLFLALKQFSDGLSLTKPAMVITLIAVIINIALNWLLIYGNWSLPALDIKGAAIATLISRILMALMLVVYVFRHKAYSAFMPPLISTFNTLPLIVKILKVGLPGGLQLFFEVGAFAGAALLVGWIGTDELAAHQIVLGLAALTYMMSAGISVSGSIRVGHAFGEGNKAMIKQMGSSALFLVAIFMLFSCLIFIFLNEELIGLFIHDEKVVYTAASVLIIAGLFQFSDGLQVVALGILRGIEDVNVPTIITLLAYWAIGLPVGYLLGFVLDMGIRGVWFGLLAGLTTSAVLLTFRFYILVNKGKTKVYEATKLVKQQGR
jgi:MATE family multidrug resistance protein